MAKLQVIEPPKPNKDFILSLNEEEAICLASLLGRTSTEAILTKYGEDNYVVEQLWNLLRKNLPEVNPFERPSLVNSK